MDPTDGAFFAAYDSARDELPEIVIDVTTASDEIAQRNVRAALSQLSANDVAGGDVLVDDTTSQPHAATAELVIDETMTPLPAATTAGVQADGNVPPEVVDASELLPSTDDVKSSRPHLRVHDPDELASSRTASRLQGLSAPIDEKRTVGEGRRDDKLPLSMASHVGNDVSDSDSDALASQRVTSFTWPAVCTNWEEAAASALRQTASWLMAKTVGRHITVAVTSCRHGEGRTSATMMLARLAARGGLTSAIVDADVQNPRLAAGLGLDWTVGWTDALDGTAALAEVVIEATDEPIAVVPTVRPLDSFGSLANNLSVGMQLRMLRERFELVVLDVGPLEETGQTTFIKSLTDGGHVDGVLLVRDVRNTGREEADSLGECLRAASIPLWGVIENFTDAA